MPKSPYITLGPGLSVQIFMVIMVFIFFSSPVWNVYAIEESSSADLYRDMVSGINLL